MTTFRTPASRPQISRCTRRDALRWGMAGTGAVLGGSHILLTPPAAGAATARSAKAKSVIQVWLWGGSCHIDTFDPKPDAGNDYTGPLKSTSETNVTGVRLGELLPQLSKQADKFTLIRSLTHGNNGHETAAYMVQTAREPGGRDVYPCAGAVVSLLKSTPHSGAQGAEKPSLIPPYIVVSQPQGRFSEAGFLGTRYKPFATGGDPGKTPFVVEGVVAQGITGQRQQRRREFLGRLDTLGQTLPADSQLQALRETEEQAYDLILGNAGKVFDLTQEPDAMRERYGRNTFGQSCLLARRLVEKSVPYVTINYSGWDTHKNHFQTMQRKLPELDAGLATLLADLKDRGLLENTIVWCCGEFGRTPKVQWEPPWNGGRNHFGKVFSVLVAGGGFQGGHVVGASNATGEEVADRPVYPVDLIGSMYELLGIDTGSPLPHPQGQVATVLPPPSDAIKSGGRLKEIM